MTGVVRGCRHAALALADAGVEGLMLSHNIAARGIARSLVSSCLPIGSCVFNRADALGHEDLTGWVTACHAHLLLILL